MASTEKKIEEYLRQKIKKLGGIAYKFTSPAYRSVPDRLVVLPTGLIYFVEVKAPMGKLTAGQKRELTKLRNLGCDAVTVWNKKDVDNLIAKLYRSIQFRKEQQNDSQQIKSQP